ncbi:hypothetical protein E2F47_27260 [Mycobacterium eburneum]|nr:hypothetical protein [Mycobacterium eburneum]TDH46250.1 hypothetical protein E2F47_27260 [Mycobacterium eburneum]
MLPARPGDVLAVYGGDGWFNKLIRLGAWLQRKPGPASHVVIVTHWDGQKWMGVQGQPSGVGPVDVTPYLRDKRTRSNNAQPRTDGGVAPFLAAANAAMGTPYDWIGIAQDACNALGLDGADELLDRIWYWPGHAMPTHVVCSSLAAALYRLVGWAHPSVGDERNCAPCDWWQWADTRAWENAA